MSQSFLITFRKGVSLSKISEEEISIRFSSVKLTLSQVTPGLLAAITSLLSSGATKEKLGELVHDNENPARVAQLHDHLEHWSKLCLLCYTVIADGQPLATLAPMTRGFQFDCKAVDADTRFRLSRFAYCRRLEDALVVESPLCKARIVLPGRTGAALVAELTRPRAYPDLCVSFEGLTEDTAQAFLSLLANSGLVTKVDADGSTEEDVDHALGQWEFHDLLFHSRSRSGTHDYPMGGAYPFLGKIAPLPAVRMQMTGELTALYAPNIDDLKANDLPFTRVLESRKSIRDYSRRLITVRQLGEFLYRTARVRHVTPADPQRSRFYEISSRPYPSGGSAYDIELYVTVNRCDGIASGIYHYDPLKHQLCKITEYNVQVEALLLDAQFAAALSFRPQILITLTSRFQRLSWKYRSLAYATTLKNVGVLYQTMYLVATAMALAPCALGAGNSSLFAEAIGTDYVVESSVGEFILGSLPVRR